MARLQDLIGRLRNQTAVGAWLGIALISAATGFAQPPTPMPASTGVAPAPPSPVNRPAAVQPAGVAPLAEATLSIDGLRYAGFSHDAASVRVGSTQGQFQWLAATDLAPLDQHEGIPPFGVASSAIAPDHKSIAVGGWNGDIVLFDSRTDQITAQLPVPFDVDRTAVTALALTEDAGQCVVGNRSSIVRMYRVASSELLWASEPLDQEITGVAVSKDGAHVAVSTGVLKDFRAPGKIVALDATTGKVRHSWLDTTAKVNHVAIAADSRTLLAADNSALRLYDLISGQLVHTAPALAGAQRLKFIDDRRCLVSLYPGRLLIWDVTSRRSVVRYAGHKKGVDASTSQLIWALDASPDGKKLVTADTLGQVYLWPIPAK